MTEPESDAASADVPLRNARSEPPSSAAFRRTGDVREAHAADASFVAYLRERVGERLRAVVECDSDPTVRFRRTDFDLEPSDLPAVSDGLRIDHRCTAAFRDGSVWLSFERSDGRCLVVADARPSRDLARLAADCRGALAAADRIESDG